MRAASIAWVLVLFAGCVQPKPVTPTPAPESCDPVGQLLALPRLAVEAEPVLVDLDGPLDSCTLDVTAELEALAPSGRTIAVVHTLMLVPRVPEGAPPHQVRTARTTFTPDEPGNWTLTAKWSTGGVTTQAMIVARALPVPVTVRRRFVDRMDICTRGPFRTQSGLTLCQRSDDQVWAYGGDGEVADHFPGLQLAVRGDEVWSWQAGQLEHRTAIGAGLRLDGAVPMGLGAEGVTRPSLAVRGEASRVLEISWDGTALTTRTIAEGYSIGDGQVVAEGAATWTPWLCKVERGCSQTLCPSVWTCPLWVGSPVAVEDRAIWFVREPERRAAGVTTFTFAAVPRPLDLTTLRASPAAIWFDETSQVRFPLNVRQPMVERMRLVSLGDMLLLPRFDADSTMGFDAIRRAGPVETVTDEWILSRGEDVFTLLATPLPPR